MDLFHVFKKRKTEGDADGGAMNHIGITGTKWYVDIACGDNVARFDGEMGLKGFYAIASSATWIKHTGMVTEEEIPNLIKAVMRRNKRNAYQVYFLRDDGSAYR